MPNVDLTPFGFTPTESQAYGALVAAGPSSGYALAKDMGIARANAYQALDGLVGKGAARLISAAPKTYRAMAPRTVVAAITQQATERLERLERALASLPPEGASSTIPFSGEQQLIELSLRSAVRVSGTVRCVAPPALLSRLTPLWRKRSADKSPTELWSIGEPPETFPVALAGVVLAERVQKSFARPPIILTAPGCALLGTASDTVSGVWTDEPLPVGLASAAIDGLR